MTEQDRKRWNERYLKKAFSITPSAVVRYFHSLARKGRALDVAAGNGRNTLFLAQAGFRVDAVDISDVAMNRLKAKEGNIQVICADLDTYDIQADTYDLIVNVRFLDRRLFPKIKAGLRKEGVLIFESYLMPSPPPDPTDSCRDYYLNENELLHAFLSLHIRFYQETETTSSGKRSRIARLVGVNAV